MLLFIVCSSFALFSLKDIIIQKSFLTFLSTSLNASKIMTSNFLLSVLVLFLFCNVLIVYIFSEYEFHSIKRNCIIFRRTLQAPHFLDKFMWLFNVFTFFLFWDRYLVIQALEIRSLPREAIKFEQRHSISQEVFNNTKVQKYGYEDVSAYLKKSQQGAQEISIREDGTIKVRRYVFGTSRLLNKAIENARSALARMRGGLESLSFKVESDIISEEELLKLTQLPESVRYGQHKSILCVHQNPSEVLSFNTHFVSIISIEGQPEHKLYRELTQHDQFIRHCLNLQAEFNFITNFKSLKIKPKKLQQLIMESNDDILIDNDFLNVVKAQRQEEASEYLTGIKSGFTRVSTYALILTKNEEICRDIVLDIENSLNTIYSGIQYSIKTTILEGRKLKHAYNRFRLKLSIENETKMSTFHLSPFTHLPEKPVFGIESNYIPEFEIPLDAINTVDGIEIGTLIFKEKTLKPLKVKIEDLRRNTTVIGLIGSGKTCLTKNLVLELTKKAPLIDWIIFDYKSEYTQLLSLVPREVLNNLIILAPGSEYAPLKVNIFDPCGFSSEEHADRVFSLIREVYSTMFQQDIDLSVQMERVLKDVLDGYIADPRERIKGFEGFLKALDTFAEKNKGKFSYLEKTVTALHNRLNKFTRGILKEIFDVKKSNISFDDLITRKVIVDLGYLQSQRVPKDDIRFLMNILVRLYGAHAIKRGLQEQLRNLIIVEECQFLVPELYRKQTSIDATPTEDLSILLRAYGVGFVFVGTRPLFAENSLANSYTIISFQLTKDAELLQKYMNLDERQANYLKRMRSQEYIIFSPSLKYPTRVCTNDFKGNDVSEEVIRTNNLSNYPNLYESMPSYAKEHVGSITDTVKTTTCAECTADEFVDYCKYLCNKSSMECCKTTHKTAMNEGGNV